MNRKEELCNKLFEHRVKLMYDAAIRESANVRERHAIRQTLHGSAFAWEVTNDLIYKPFSKIREYFTEAYLQPYAASDFLVLDDRRWLEGKLDHVFREQLLRAKGIIQRLCLDNARIQPKDIQPQLSDFDIRANQEIKQSLLREIELLFLFRSGLHNRAQNDSRPIGFIRS